MCGVGGSVIAWEGRFHRFQFHWLPGRKVERYLRDVFSGGEASAPLLEIKRNGKVELGCPNLESTECAYSEAYKILTVAITRERGVEEAEALETWGFPVSRNILRGLRLAAGSTFSMWRWLEGSLCSLGQEFSPDQNGGAFILVFVLLYALLPPPNLDYQFKENISPQKWQ